MAHNHYFFPDHCTFVCKRFRIPIKSCQNEHLHTWIIAFLFFIFSPAFENRKPIGAIDSKSGVQTQQPPISPLHRPGTANAILQPSSNQPRIRRQLPRVPGLPSKPPLPR